MEWGWDREEFLANDSIADQLKIQIVVLSADSLSVTREQPTLKPLADGTFVIITPTVPLLVQIRENPNWALVHVDAMYAIFLRRNGDNDSLIAASELTQEKLLSKINEHITMLAGMDSQQAYPLYVGATTLLRLQWREAAEAVYRAALERDDKYHEAWNSLGRVLAEQGEAKGRAGIEKLREAKRCFIRALEISPKNPEANHNYDKVVEDLKNLK